MPSVQYHCVTDLVILVMWAIYVLHVLGRICLRLINVNMKFKRCLNVIERLFKQRFYSSCQAFLAE